MERVVMPQAKRKRDVGFKGYAERWLESVRGTVKDSTYRLTYRNSVVNHLIPYFGEEPLRNIRQMDIQLYFNREGQTRSLESLRKYKSCLQGIFESAVDNGLLARSPVRNIKLVSAVVPQKKQVYGAEDVARVLTYADGHRFGLEVKLLLRLGLRRGELLGIRWGDVDWTGRVLHIRRAVADVPDPETGRNRVTVDEPKTRFSVRDIPLPEDLAEELRERRERGEGGEEFVFCGRDGGVCSPRTWSRRHYDVFMREMQAYYAALPEPVTVAVLHPHELRHTCASLLVNANKNLFAIAAVLGWANLKMLRERYAHEDIESIREELDL